MLWGTSQADGHMQCFFAYHRVIYTNRDQLVDLLCTWHYMAGQKRNKVGKEQEYTCRIFS